ncbi:aldehyde dehydrogenase family protein [Streptomyces silvae]|uniref:Aldehyde dehydrogenase family protein n=1 Tax=Streptomyces silvae TaxID=2803812 RepID=A0ABU7ZU54_9ACTN
MIRRDQQQRVIDYINIGIEDGARLVTGGPHVPEGLEKGNYVTPTVFADVDNSMRIAQEEIFGPVLVVIAYDDDDDAVRIANDSQYGLSGGIWTSDPDRALATARRLRTGTVTLNGSPISFDGPFGGYKASGLGREYWQGRPDRLRRAQVDHPHPVVTHQRDGLPENEGPVPHRPRSAHHSGNRSKTMGGAPPSQSRRDIRSTPCSPDGSPDRAGRLHPVPGVETSSVRTNSPRPTGTRSRDEYRRRLRAGAGHRE